MQRALADRLKLGHAESKGQTYQKVAHNNGVVVPAGGLIPSAPGIIFDVA